MRTTLNLDDRLILELMKATHARTKTEAITQAISDMIRRKKLEKLKSLSGKMHLAKDWKKHEQADIQRQTRLMRLRHGHH